MTVLLPPEVIVPLDPRHRQVPYVLRVTAALEELQTKLSVRRGNMLRVVLLHVQIAHHIRTPTLPGATPACVILDTLATGPNVCRVGLMRYRSLVIQPVLL